MCCSRLAANTGRKKSRQNSSPGHHRTTSSGYICATKAHIDNPKKLVKQQYVLYMSQQYGELRPTSGWDPFVSLRHPCKFQLVSHLGSVTALHLVVGVSQTLQRWTEGATYIRQGGHHVGHWLTFLACNVSFNFEHDLHFAGVRARPASGNSKVDARTWWSEGSGRWPRSSAEHRCWPSG